MPKRIEDWASGWSSGPITHQTPWPAGDYPASTQRLRQLLALSARWHSRTAVRLFLSDDRDELLQSAISVGTASELLLKALIHMTSPALLAHQGHRDSLLLLAEATPDLPSPHEFKSIPAREAHLLAKHLHRGLPIDPNRLDALTARNAAAHLAIVDPQQLRRAVVQHCQLAAASLQIMGLDERLFWGADLFRLVSELMTEARDEVARIAQLKLRSARASLNIKLSSLPEPARVAYLAALSGTQRTYTDHEEPAECPVCFQGGWLLCVVEKGAVEQDSETSVTWKHRTAYPFGFECNVCGLHLEDDELWEADAFPVEIELEPEEVLDELEEFWPPN